MLSVYDDVWCVFRVVCASQILFVYSIQTYDTKVMVNTYLLKCILLWILACMFDVRCVFNSCCVNHILHVCMCMPCR